MGDDTQFRNRRFGLAVAFTLAGFALIMLDKIGGGEFVMLSATVLGLYGGVEALGSRK